MALSDEEETTVKPASKQLFTIINESPLSRAKRSYLVTFGCIQNVLGGGLIYGWAGVAGSMLTASRQDGGAGLALDQTTRIFTWASSMSFMSPLVLGIVLDRYGPRKCSVLSNILIGSGCLVFASSQSYEQFVTGASIFAFGGPGIQSSLVHLGNLFPKQKNFVMSCVTGMITLSFAVLPILDIIWERWSIGFHVMFRIYGIIILISAMCSWILWPDVPFEVDHLIVETEFVNVKNDTGSELGWVEEKPFVAAPDTKLVHQPLDSYLRSNSHNQLHHSTSFFMSKKAIESGDDRAIIRMSVKDLPFWKQLFSGAFLRASLFFVVTSFWANFYVAALTTELGDQQFFELSQQHHLARSFSFITALGIVGSPIVGFLLDKIGLVRTALLTILMGVMHMLLILIRGNDMSVVAASFICYSLFRAFLFPYFFAFLSMKLGFKYFGVLSGIAFAASGIAQLCMAPLSSWAQGTCHDNGLDGSLVEGEKLCSQGNWQKIHLIELFTLCMLVFVPIVDSFVDTLRMKSLKDVLGTPRSPFRFVRRMESSYGTIEEGSEMSGIEF